MWYYDEGGSGWTLESASDALCIFLRGLLVYTPDPPSGYQCESSCAYRYYVTVSGIVGTCGDHDCSEFNGIYTLDRQENQCAWYTYNWYHPPVDPTEFRVYGSITIGFCGAGCYMWSFGLSTGGYGACGAAFKAFVLISEGESCPPTGIWPLRTSSPCSGGIVTVSHS